MPIIAKGKCDAEGCMREFELGNGGFAVMQSLSDTDALVKIARITDIQTMTPILGSITVTVCGKECLYKVIDALIEQLPSTNPSEPTRGPKDESGTEGCNI